MAKYFNIKDIRGRIELNLPCNGKRYVVTAENENGDTFHKTTDDSEVFDYIDEDNEEFERKREDAEYSIRMWLKDEDCWKRKATIKAYQTNATIFYGDQSKEISYDLQPDFFDSRKDAEEWADDELWELEDILNNYDYIKETLVSAVEKFIKD